MAYDAAIQRRIHFVIDALPGKDMTDSRGIHIFEFYSNALFPLLIVVKAVEQMSAEKALPNHDPGDRVRDGRFAGMVPAADHRQIAKVILGFFHM